MKAYVYGKKRELPEGFEEFVDRAHSAIVSIDMHQGHLADTPDCPCPAPRAREIVAPIDAFHDQCARLGVPIVHVRTVLRKGGVDDVRAARRHGAWSSRCMSATSRTPTSTPSKAAAGRAS